MAFEIDLEDLGTGAVSKYWRINTRTYDDINDFVEVVYGGYVSEKAFRDGKSPVSTKRFRFPEAAAMTKKDIYTATMDAEESMMMHRPIINGEERVKVTPFKEAKSK